MPLTSLTSPLDAPFQVGIAVVVFEYQRQLQKETAKKKQEHMERQRIMENARAEREVRGWADG